MARFRHQQIIATSALGVTIVSLFCLLAVQTLVPADVSWGYGRWLLAVLAIVSAAIAVFSVWKLPQLLLGPINAFVDAFEYPRAASDAAAQANAHPHIARLARAAARLVRPRRTDTVSSMSVDQVLASMSEAIFVTDVDGRIEYVNAAAEQLIGHDSESLLGQAIDEWLSSGSDKAVADSTIARPFEAQLRRKSGGPVFVSYVVSRLEAADDEERLIFAAQNIDDRKKAEQRIRYLARTDSLTKIANRMQFQHLLQQSIARARRTRRHAALIYLDIDRFKDINDTFGHSAGDRALEIFTERLLAILPDGATAGRLAGDEFGVLVTGSTSVTAFEDRLRTLALEMLATIGQPFEVNNEEVFMTSSLGVAIYPRDGDNVIDLIRNADAAVYEAKKAGGNCMEFYSYDMNVEAVERLMIKSRLRRAFEQDELRLHYQPKYGLKSGRIEGAEALIRWDQPDHGLLFPSDFIPLAEESNLIVQVGDWVLDKVCADYRRWQVRIPAPVRVSLNLSLRQLQQRRFLEKVRETFQQHGISPTCLELEITETTLMDDTARTVRILDALYSMGLHLAIDDFGTGYSSLSALQQFPINALKIDQSFVKDVAIDRDDASIVRTIIQMGHSLGLEVVAEGVESEEQLAFLRAENCDFAQGHLFGAPMTGEEFCDVLVADSEGTGKYRALFA
ncbi:MAG TPA: EAL domain-containing protein [Gammaproteobacteria bacterium]|nr:EAL domain-containing protein [Gammaproteobacteria bacterium]